MLGSDGCLSPAHKPCLPKPPLWEESSSPVQLELSPSIHPALGTSQGLCCQGRAGSQGSVPEGGLGSSEERQPHHQGAPCVTAVTAVTMPCGGFLIEII